MSEAGVAFTSMVGQLVASGAAVWGLLFVGRQVRDSRQATDAATLQSTYREYTDTLRRFEDSKLAGTPESHVNGFYAFVNFLEIQAAALNGKLYGAVTAEIMRDLLCSAIVDIEGASHWPNILAAGVDSPDTYKHLRNFYARERRKITEIRRGRART